MPRNPAPGAPAPGRVPPPAEKPKRFKACGIGYFHVDTAELRCAGGKVAARGLLLGLLRSVPCQAHTALTGNGARFVGHREAGNANPLRRFGRARRLRGMERRLAKPCRPWTNGRAKRTVRTIKDAAVDAFHRATIAELRRHVGDRLAAHNFARQLKAPRWRTPLQATAAVHAQRPNLSLRPPGHFTPGPNT